MRRAYARRGAWLWLVLLASIQGCTTDAIIVSEVAITDRPDARVLGWTADEEPRQVFSPEDEAVTVKVLFQFNYRAVYEWYDVAWIAPDGSTYLALSLRTDFGSHRDLKASMPIRGKRASRMPGIWRVRVSLRGRDDAPDRLLVARIFRIASPSAEEIARGLTSVDVPTGPREHPLAGRPVTHAAEGTLQASPSASNVGDARAREAGVLAPLGLGVPSAPAAATELPTAAPQAAPDVAVVTLEATSEDAARPRHGFRGCPPMYYLPGPDCVEQAPEE